MGNPGLIMKMFRVSAVCQRGITTALLFFMVTIAPIRAAVLVAEYRFNSNLVSSVIGAPALVPVDPLSGNGFNFDTVNGLTQTVYSWNGLATPVTSQAGFTLDTTGFLPTNNYSVEMVFKLTARDNQWRRLIDVENRQSDDGFYFDPGNHLDVYPIISSVTSYVTGTYVEVYLTVGGGIVTAYLNGVQQFSGPSTLMNINVNNIGYTMGFFIDNVVAGGQGEFSNGSIALLRLYGGVVSPAPVLSIKNTPTNSVVVSWPSPSLGWNLQSNTNLATTNWTAYAGSISDNGTNRSVVVTPPSAMKYFRLVNH